MYHCFPAAKMARRPSRTPGKSKRVSVVLERSFTGFPADEITHQSPLAPRLASMSAPRTKNPVPSWIENPYPQVQHSIVSFPRKHVLLVTINRPEHMNCLPVEATIELGALWRWYDAEPELRAAVFTGAGQEAFCAGMDLKQRLDILKTNDVAFDYPHGGFGGMSNRTGKKPIIIACNGHAHGKPIPINCLVYLKLMLFFRRWIRDCAECRCHICLAKC